TLYITPCNFFFHSPVSIAEKSSVYYTACYAGRVALALYARRDTGFTWSVYRPSKDFSTVCKPKMNLKKASFTKRGRLVATSVKNTSSGLRTEKKGRRIYYIRRNYTVAHDRKKGRKILAPPLGVVEKPHAFKNKGSGYNGEKYIEIIGTKD
ncbi:hypothetical protein L9F63_002579, partial [Diploptera punctata]